MCFFLSGEHPALTLITVTLQEQRIKNQNADNLTAIVIFLEHGKIDAKFKASSTAAGSHDTTTNATTKTDFSNSRDGYHNAYHFTPPPHHYEDSASAQHNIPYNYSDLHYNDFHH